MIEIIVVKLALRLGLKKAGVCRQRRSVSVSRENTPVDGIAYDVVGGLESPVPWAVAIVSVDGR